MMYLEPPTLRGDDETTVVFTQNMNKVHLNEHEIDTTQKDNEKKSKDGSDNQQPP